MTKGYQQSAVSYQLSAVSVGVKVGVGVKVQSSEFRVQKKSPRKKKYAGIFYSDATNRRTYKFSIFSFPFSTILKRTSAAVAVCRYHSGDCHAL